MEKALIVVLGAMFALLLLWIFFTKLSVFREEMDYINLELARCSEASRKKWKREKRKLWLWLLFSLPKD